MTQDTRELVTRLRKGDQMDGETVRCKFDACNCAIMDEAATALTEQAERIAELEKRLAGLHQATEKMRETANREFHRANKADDNWLRWIAENGLGEEARRARAALKGES